jgi:hypothetical protein
LQREQNLPPSTPKAELRAPKEARNPKSERHLSRRAAVLRERQWLRTSDFGFLSAFGIRHFGFGPNLSGFGGRLRHGVS